jgi:hypothetical protein
MDRRCELRRVAADVGCDGEEQRAAEESGSELEEGMEWFRWIGSF